MAPQGGLLDDVLTIFQDLDVIHIQWRAVAVGSQSADGNSMGIFNDLPELATYPT